MPTAEAEVPWALDALAQATRLREWMFSVLRPTMPGSALEIGAGIGTFSELLLGSGVTDLVVLEPDRECAAFLERRFSHESRMRVVDEPLPGSPTLAEFGATFPYALCQNVLEHIADDAAALAEIADALAPGGEVALLVPAHPWLFGRLDVRFGHFRRYTRAGLTRLIETAGLQIEDLRSFNLLGVPGWWLAGHTNVVGLSAGSLRVFERFVPLARAFDRAFRPPVGLSLVARARKPST